MSEDIIKDFSDRIETARQQAESDFKMKVEGECVRIDNQPVNSVRIAELKKAFLEQLRTSNRLQCEILDCLNRGERFILKDSFFERDDHLISLLDNETMPPEFNDRTWAYILMPKEIQETLLSRLKFRYCLIPFAGIVLALTLFWTIPLMIKLLTK